MVPLTRRKCRSCDAEIYWVFTEHGNRMPIDADPRDDGNVALIQSPSGRRVRVLPPEGMFEDEDLTALQTGESIVCSLQYPPFLFRMKPYGVKAEPKP